MQYAADVLSGRVVACRWVRLAVERHLRDLDEAEIDNDTLIAAVRLANALETSLVADRGAQRSLGMRNDAKGCNDIDLMQFVPDVGSRSRQIGMRQHTADAGIVHDDIETPPPGNCLLHQA